MQWISNRIKGNKSNAKLINIYNPTWIYFSSFSYSGWYDKYISKRIVFFVLWHITKILSLFYATNSINQSWKNVIIWKSSPIKYCSAWTNRWARRSVNFLNWIAQLTLSRQRRLLLVPLRHIMRLFRRVALKVSPLWRSVNSKLPSSYPFWNPFLLSKLLFGGRIVTTKAGDERVILYTIATKKIKL